MQSQDGKNIKAQDLRHFSKRTFGEKLADEVALKAGSWNFIIFFLVFMLLWVSLNAFIFIARPWDPYPFILLNLVLSTIAALQAPVILMSQNRASEMDRKRAELDYYINRRAEREIKILQKDVLEMKEVISAQPLTKDIEKLKDEILKLQDELSESQNELARKYNK
ncbi:MAG: DUF1003 domain-containing protein [archaeon]|nr:DUF1003 domain-containing protein [archaeon]